MINVTSTIFSSQLIGSKIHLTSHLTQTEWRRDSNLAINTFIIFYLSQFKNLAVLFVAKKHPLRIFFIAGQPLTVPKDGILCQKNDAV